MFGSKAIRLSDMEEKKIADAMMKEGSVLNEIKRNHAQSPTGFGTTFLRSFENTLSKNNSRDVS